MLAWPNPPAITNAANWGRYVAASGATAITEGVAWQFRQEIDDFVADSELRMALKHLQDFASYFGSGHKDEVMMIRGRFNQLKEVLRAGGKPADNISAIRAAVLDLSDQIYDEAMLIPEQTAPPVQNIATETKPPDRDTPADTAVPVETFVPANGRQDGTLTDKRREVIRELRATGDWLACSCKQVTRTYRRGDFALRPIDLDLWAGEITGIVGRNGS